ncbi:MAG: cobyric acid synthase [Bryobacteraceae bacterium]
MRAKAIFVGGTASHAGKSWMATAICRHLKQRGFRVAPFKAQNMSNNSFPCAGGGEIGRAQVAQAEACELAPEPDMNPILLKPTSDQGSQVILHGKVFGDFAARDYYSKHAFLRNEAHQAYDRLSSRFEYVVIEGAGSIAEMNLKSRDLVNLSMAAYADARGLLVADIDRGGVFASICGTLELLPPEERALVKSFAVNRFRGDRSLFADGEQFIEQRVGVPCLGVFPMASEIALDAEDGVSLDDAASFADARIAIVRLPHISNFTDFRLLACQWISRPINKALDWIILPGTKNTIGDLDWLRRQGLADWICQQHRSGAKVLGICGGYQMLGESIDDPECVESPEPRSCDGLGLLPVRTVLAKAKVTRTVAARTPQGCEFGAYEIHMGQTASTSLEPFAYLPDGATDGARGDRVWGTYLHGALESPGVVHELFGIAVTALPSSVQFDRLADWFRGAADMRLFEERFL